MKKRETQGNFLVCAGLALASAVLAVTCDLQTCLMLACAAFWGAQARREWRVLLDARESENRARRQLLRRRLLGGGES